MSHQALHRVTVRMLFDSTFATRVHSGEESLPELPARERDWLRRVDPRAWTVDHQRPVRTLRELSAEFKSSCAIAVGRTRSITTLSDFFRSPPFHHCVQQRGSLDVAFAAYLAGLDRVPPDLLALEAAMARCRREHTATPERLRKAPADPWVARARGVGALSVDTSTLPCLNRVEERLFELSLQPLLALSTDGPQLPDLPTLTGELDHLVLQPRNGEPVPSRLGKVVCHTLQKLDDPVPTEDFPALSGLAENLAQRLLQDLVTAGLVVTGAAQR